MFLILEPHARSTLFPFIANRSFTKFIDDTSQSKSIDTQWFWEIREFYAPGSFEINKTGFQRTDVPEYVNQMIPVTTQEYFTPFLIFSSNRFQSVEFLTSITPPDLAMFRVDFSKNEIILDTYTDLIYRKDNYVYVIFLRPVEVMQETNGFLDYKEHDKELIKGKQWLVISRVKLQ